MISTFDQAHDMATEGYVPETKKQLWKHWKLGRGGWQHKRYTI